MPRVTARPAAPTGPPTGMELVGRSALMPRAEPARPLGPCKVAVLDSEGNEIEEDEEDDDEYDEEDDEEYYEDYIDEESYFSSMLGEALLEGIRRDPGRLQAL
jgi:hypothetical protein